MSIAVLIFPTYLSGSTDLLKDGPNIVFQQVSNHLLKDLDGSTYHYLSCHQTPVQDQGAIEVFSFLRNVENWLKNFFDLLLSIWHLTWILFCNLPEL